ncbi:MULTISPECIES: hypothetical protein [unclassified Caulobacter]|uniref:hypothetical protein n=1 Tax=unclassified Caulobacter TaxID=2648921 RepID=UPI001304F433|nr:MULTISPECIES: hypothetical protein [unclassified Caulobacter]
MRAEHELLGDFEACAPSLQTCRSCGPGIYTGLPGNACSDCMDTGLDWNGDSFTDPT